LISAATDVALVMDADGVIRDAAFQSPDGVWGDHGRWLGRTFAETVTVESRPKALQLLEEARAKAQSRARQLNHPLGNGLDAPVRYAMLQVGDQGRFLALGHDLRNLARVQQQLLDAQVAMEREYGRLRQAETRYRLLFQLAAEAVLILEAGTFKVVDANPAASELLSATAGSLIGRPAVSLFAPADQAAVALHLASIQANGRGEPLRAHLAANAAAFVSGSIFRQDRATHLLLRLSPLAGGAPMRDESQLIRLVRNLPEGFVVTDLDYRILDANASFLELAEVGALDQIKGESLGRWLGRPGVDTSILLSTLRDHGSLRNFTTVLHGELGGEDEVEVSAVMIPDGEIPCCGFVIRRLVGRASAGRPRLELPHSAEQIAELVGRVSLKEIVRETTDVIERLCILAALKLTGDNRASAAQVLGLSRQSLYLKLRRFGLGDLDGDGEDDESE
jgi:transcriptional regulator PpsR